MKPSVVKWLLFGDVLACGPYLLIAWAFTALGDGTRSTFWYTFAVLLGIRILIALIDGLINWLRWRLAQRRDMVQAVLDSLRYHKFPQRMYETDDLDMYLLNIVNNESGEDNRETYDCELPTRFAAARLQQNLLVLGSFGMVKAWRSGSAYTEAFERYAPAASAKHSVDDLFNAFNASGGAEDDEDESDFVPLTKT